MQEIIECWCHPDYSIPLLIIAFILIGILWELHRIERLLKRDAEKRVS